MIPRASWYFSTAAKNNVTFDQVHTHVSSQVFLFRHFALAILTQLFFLYAKSTNNRLAIPMSNSLHNSLQLLDFENASRIYQMSTHTQGDSIPNKQFLLEKLNEKCKTIKNYQKLTFLENSFNKDKSVGL